MVMPTSASGRSRRITSTARPCESSTWWAAARASRSLRRPGVAPSAVAEPGDDPRLVLRDPAGDAVAEPRDDDLHVLRERLGRVAHRPAPAVLERLRQIPVIQGRERLDAVREQLVDEPVVVVEPRLVHGATALGDDPRPRDREAIRVETELLHEAHVLRVAVVRVAGDRPVSPLATRPGVVKRSQILSPRRPPSPRPRSGTPRWRRPRRTGVERHALCRSM